MRNNACDALRRAIDKYRATAPLAAEAGKSGRALRVLVQVNTPESAEHYGWYG